MTTRLNVHIIFPSRSSLDRPPPSLRGVPWGEFPRFIGTIQRLRLLVSPLCFVAFTQQFHPAPPCSFPTSVGATLAGPGPFLSRGARTAVLQCRMESTRPPRFLREPLRTCPALRPRRTARSWPNRRKRCCLPRAPRRRLRKMFHFGAVSRGLHVPCVRLAHGIASAIRNTRFRLVANLCRYRAFTCWVPLEGFSHVLYMASSFSKLCLAQGAGEL